jgi:NAD(P)-dependent dehydrogenase (short-subunit alcohol dehydrogenase family)
MSNQIFMRQRLLPEPVRSATRGQGSADAVVLHHGVRTAVERVEPSAAVRSETQQAPIGRAAQPVELAPAYVFLASQESSYIAGETIGVTGGTPLP